MCFVVVVRVARRSGGNIYSDSVYGIRINVCIIMYMTRETVYYLRFFGGCFAKRISFNVIIFIGNKNRYRNSYGLDGWFRHFNLREMNNSVAQFG